MGPSRSGPNTCAFLAANGPAWLHASGEKLPDRSRCPGWGASGQAPPSAPPPAGGTRVLPSPVLPSCQCPSRVEQRVRVPQLQPVILIRHLLSGGTAGCDLAVDGIAWWAPLGHQTQHAFKCRSQMHR